MNPSNSHLQLNTDQLARSGSTSSWSEPSNELDEMRAPGERAGNSSQEKDYVIIDDHTKGGGGIMDMNSDKGLSDSDSQPPGERPSPPKLKRPESEAGAKSRITTEPLPMRISPAAASTIAKAQSPVQLLQQQQLAS